LIYGTIDSLTSSCAISESGRGGEGSGDNSQQQFLFQFHGKISLNVREISLANLKIQPVTPKATGYADK
jgi:hypothetical protein